MEIFALTSLSYLSYLKIKSCSEFSNSAVFTEQKSLEGQNSGLERNVLQWAELSTLTLTGYMMSKTKNHHLSADSCDDLFLPEQMPVTLVTV